MKHVVDGISYVYDVISLSDKDKFYFSIEATHKTSHRKATITTINPILSELKITESDKRFKESVWILNKKESSHFMKIATQLLSNQNYLKYFEDILDKDRSQSEWENINCYSSSIT